MGSEEMDKDIAKTIIENPGVNDVVIAYIHNCHESTVGRYRKILNIDPKTKPEDCVG